MLIGLGLLLLLLILTLDLRYRYLPESNSALFIGLSILAGSCLIVLGTSSSTSNHDLHRAYLRFSAALERGPLTREELGKEIGSDSQSVDLQSGKSEPRSESQKSSPDAAPSGSASVYYQRSLSRKEHALLDRMLYEGKLIERGGKLALPS